MDATGVPERAECDILVIFRWWTSGVCTQGETRSARECSIVKLPEMGTSASLFRGTWNRAQQVCLCATDKLQTCAAKAKASSL